MCNIPSIRQPQLSNLLYLQTELTHLERKLRRLEAADLASAEGNRSNYSKDWYWLNNSIFEENSEQLETVHAIRGKLKEYSQFFDFMPDSETDDLRNR
jgi:hypothetical protein